MTDSPVTAQRYISDACEEDLLKYGDSFRGAGYTRSALEAEQRYAPTPALGRCAMSSVDPLPRGTDPNGSSRNIALLYTDAEIAIGLGASQEPRSRAVLEHIVATATKGNCRPERH